MEIFFIACGMYADTSGMECWLFFYWAYLGNTIQNKIKWFMHYSSCGMLYVALLFHIDEVMKWGNILVHTIYFIETIMILNIYQ